MSGRFIESQRKDPSRFVVKRERLQMLPKTVSYPLNAPRQYERDCEMVLRSIARFIHNRGFCPNVTTLAFAQTWDKKATQQYIEDLNGCGYVEIFYKVVVDLSSRGWDVIGIVPIVPIIPHELSVRAGSLPEMTSVLKRLGTPEIQAAYREFKENRNAKIENHGP
jgi:hypothetical protein